MGRKVFVCHSSADKVLAHQVCRDLEAAGLACWIAPRDVNPGAQWAAELAGAIDDCGVFLLIFTANSNNSSQVLREVERAVRREKVIVNYRSDSIPCASALDYYLAVHQWFDPTGSVDADMKRLAVHLQRVCGVAEQDRAETRTSSASAAAGSSAGSGTSGRSAPRPAPPRPAAAAAVTFNLSAPWIAKLPLLETFYKSLSSLPWLNSAATLTIDGAVAQKMPAVLPAVIERSLPLGNHEFELCLKMASPRKYPLRLAEPGQYTVRVGRTWVTGNYQKQCEVACNGGRAVVVKGTLRFTVWRALFLCIVALWVIGSLISLMRTP